MSQSANHNLGIPSPRPVADTEVTQEMTRGDFHRSIILNARIWLLQGDTDSAYRALGMNQPEVNRKFGSELAKSWHIMHAEIALARGNFGSVQVHCHDGHDLSYPKMPASPLYEAIFCCISAEATRRSGEPLSAAAREGLQMVAEAASSQADDRYKFVRYAAHRTLGLDAIANGDHSDEVHGARQLEQAAAARAAYMTVPSRYDGRAVERPTYRSVTRDAQPDIDKLYDFNESPMFCAVMSFPSSTD